MLVQFLTSLGGIGNAGHPFATDRSAVESSRLVGLVGVANVEMDLDTMRLQILALSRFWIYSLGTIQPRRVEGDGT